MLDMATDNPRGDPPSILVVDDCQVGFEDFRPTRLAVDSLSALERNASIKAFRKFVIGLTSHVKHTQVAGLFTATTLNLLGSRHDRDIREFDIDDDGLRTGTKTPPETRGATPR